MTRMIKWMAPAVAAFGLMIGFSSSPAVAADGGTITGTVVDKEGKPAAGLDVRVVKPRPAGERPAAPKADAEKPPEKPAPGAGGGRGGTRPEPVASGKTDDAGKFEIKGVPAGEYMVLAGSREKGMGRSKVTVETGKTVDVKLTLADIPAGGAGGGRRPGAGAPPAK
ncbi:MAG: carboxypeptidase-like regulatory domain-containing protein [Phycisphaerae bacterium]|nr:carboxypeptidase-like regulatory domain-containing protein [Tepidisphaeraceae bacterium]